MKSPKISISAQFDGGNICVIDQSNPNDIRLNIRKDNLSDFYQWFYFRVSGAKETDLKMTISNAGQSAYPKGWEDYQAVASYDRDEWFRVPTQYDGETLSIQHTPLEGTVWYAYFAPYSMERHADLIASLQGLPDLHISVLGQTHDGRELDLISIGQPSPEKRICWITARQHPGETMAEWCIEGLLDRLTDPDDAVARTLREKCVFYIVPNMNPDGSARGHLRTNAIGVNLNREWNKASLDTGPEVFHVLEAMEQTGVDFFLDCHGDEALPYNFVAGGEGAPNFTADLGTLLTSYKAALTKANPDFQTEFGYPIDRPGTGNLSVATSYITNHFQCLAMTLEMPFKDNANLMDPNFGWSPARSRKLGASQLDALHAVVDQLR